VSPAVSTNMISINQASTETSNTLELLDACAHASVGAVSLWRHQYVGGDAQLTRAAMDTRGVVATSLCRGGFFTGTRSQREADLDNHQAVEEAAILGAPVLVLVCGPVTTEGPAAAGRRIVDGIERLLPHAADHGVKLAVEPFHPMLIAERSAIVTLAQATALVRRFDHTHLGLAVDTYHVWWDPELDQRLVEAAAWITSVHVGDWLVPTTDLLASRGLPGDGVIELSPLLRQFRQLGYAGPFEVEVLNPEVWARPPADVVVDIRDRMSSLLQPLGQT
jgi:sugar phosphate isomerase/epimerase